MSEWCNKGGGCWNDRGGGAGVALNNMSPV